MIGFRDARPTRRLIRSLVATLGCLVFMAAIAAPNAVAESTAPAAAPSAAQGVVSSEAALTAAPRRVCAPSGKCVTTNNYCFPGDGCGKHAYREARPGQYCSSSVGCVSYRGKNYFYVGGPSMTAAQRTQALKCMASLGVAGLGFIGTGPGGVTILGVVVSIWGCS